LIFGQFINALNINSKQKISFAGDRYDHVIAFAARTCLLEIGLKSKSYIKNNFEYFKHLNLYLLNDLKIRDGKTFANSWNDSFLNALKKQSNSSLLNILKEKEKNQDDPLEFTFSICECIDELAKNQSEYKSELSQKLQFNRNDVVKFEPKKSFLKKLFG
jgi:hypothetical protein